VAARGPARGVGSAADATILFRPFPSPNWTQSMRWKAVKEQGKDLQSLLCHWECVPRTNAFEMSTFPPYNKISASSA
jgi:hypothetical protein